VSVPDRDEQQHPRAITRRQLLAGAVVGGASAAFLARGSAAAAGPDRGQDPQTATLTILGSTDTHGHIYNWDYYNDVEYDDAAHNDVGLAKISTLVSAMREERGGHNTLTLDAGDTIQGTPLTYYFAAIDPITAKGAPPHPMAVAMNAIGYDAAASATTSSTTACRCCASSSRSCTTRCSAATRCTGRPPSPHSIRSSSARSSCTTAGRTATGRALRAWCAWASSGW
jgi:hypothetical protein